MAPIFISVHLCDRPALLPSTVFKGRDVQIMALL